MTTQTVSASDNRSLNYYTPYVPDDGHEHVARLKKLAQELDAAKTSVDETVKHIESAQHRTEALITDDIRVIDTSDRRKRKRRPSQDKRKRKTAKKTMKARKRKRRSAIP